MQGHMRLVRALAELYNQVAGIKMHAMTDILITVGALAAMQAAIYGIIDDGDEVIVIEPFFDAYDKLVRLAGGVTRYVALRPTKVSHVFALHFIAIFLYTHKYNRSFSRRTECG